MGGVQRVVTSLANEFAGENEVTIGITNADSKALVPGYQLDNSIKIISLPECDCKRSFWSIIRFLVRKQGKTLSAGMAKKVFYSQKRIEALQSFLSRENFDAVIAVAVDNSLLLALPDKQKLKNENVRYIGWFHNTYAAYFNTNDNYAYGRKNLAKEVLGNLDQIVTLTQHDATALQENLNLSNCTYIYNPLSFTTQEKPKFNNKTLLFVGRLEEQQKGLDYLAEIANIIFKDEKFQDWKLVVVGDGSDRAKFESQIQKYGISRYVTCVGNQKDVMHHYLNADVLLLTSRWEGFGLVVTEAFECGIPVVAFHNDGPDEIITDGENGFLIERFDLEEFAEKVILLMKDEKLKKRLSKNAKKRAGDFSVERIVHKWNEVIDHGQ